MSKQIKNSDVVAVPNQDGEASEIRVEIQKTVCPCKRKKCERHGNCGACREHHAKTKRPIPCEKR